MPARGLRDYPLERITYRDGSTCPGPSSGRPPAVVTCPPVGYRRPRGAAPTSAQVARPLHLRLRQVRAYGATRLQIRVSFRAPIAVSGAASYYELETHLPQAGRCRGLQAAPITINNP